MLVAFPHHCDALALSNVLHEQEQASQAEAAREQPLGQQGLREQQPA